MSTPQGTSKGSTIMASLGHRSDGGCPPTFPTGVTMSDTVKYLLDESRMPKDWYNVQADLPEPLAPPLNPGTGHPSGPTLSKRSSRRRSSSRRCRRSAGSKSQMWFGKYIVNGGRARCIERDG